MLLSYKAEYQLFIHSIARNHSSPEFFRRNLPVYMAIFGYNYPEDGYEYLERQSVETVLRNSFKIVKQGSVLMNKEFLAEAVRLFVDHNRYREALFISRQLLAYSPCDAEIWYQKSLCLVHFEQYENAQKAVKKALLFDPQNLEVLSEYALILVHLNKNKSALKVMDKALSLHPNDPAVYSFYGKVLGMLSRFDTAIEYYERSISLDPLNSEAYFMLAQTYIDLGQDDEALTIYDKYLDIVPDCPYGWLNKGIFMEAKGRLQDALHCYELSTALDSGLSEAWFNAANLYADFDFINEAIDAFKKVLEVDPEDTLAMYNIATVYEESRDFKSALRYYKACLKTDPEHINARLGIGYCKYKLRKKGRALEHLRMAMHKDLIHRSGSGKSPITADEFAAAEEVIRVLLLTAQIGPLKNGELKILCEAQERIGQYAEALETASKMLKLKEVNGETFYTFSRLQFIAGNNVEGIINLKKAFAFNRNLFSRFTIEFPEVVNSKLFKEIFRFSGLVEPPVDERYYG